jgi:ribonuclease HII
MYAGVDEAGRGPVLGPLGVAGVAGDPQAVPDGVADSKTLTAERRRQLLEAIEAAELAVAVRVLDAGELNERMGSGENLNELEASAFGAVLDDLAAEEALLDQVGPDGGTFADEVDEHLAHECAITAEVEADVDDPLVGAASIVAKVERDRAMERIAEELDAEVGSGYAHDVRTRSFLRAWREDSVHPPPFARHAWDTLDDMGFGQLRLGETDSPDQPAEETLP